MSKIFIYTKTYLLQVEKFKNNNIIIKLYIIIIILKKIIMIFNYILFKKIICQILITLNFTEVLKKKWKN